MKVNFDIIDNRAIGFDGRHIDLHNNFDLVSFDYNVTLREFRLFWRRSEGDWIGENEISGIILIHKLVSYLSVSKGEENTFEDARCLGEISYFPSTARDMNDSIIPRSKPNDGDDILYFFENGKLIRVHCEQISATIPPVT